MKRCRILAFSLMVLSMSCTQERSMEGALATLQLNFQHRAAGNAMKLNAPIVNPHGEPYTLTNFAYYLSALALVHTDGTTVPLGRTYHLVSEQLADSKKQTLSAPAGTYKALQMTIGVDSTRNVSGVQSGALDPAKGMFWSWNTGYIFAKMEAKSPVSTAPLNNVTYHIGGFRTGENALQTVTLPFPETLRVREGAQPVLYLTANADAWFEGRHEITIAKEAFCMNPSTLAVQIAENYKNMFQVVQVEN